jgi:hypothetical protein
MVFLATLMRRSDGYTEKGCASETLAVRCSVRVTGVPSRWKKGAMATWAMAELTILDSLLD